MTAISDRAPVATREQSAWLGPSFLVLMVVFGFATAARFTKLLLLGPIGVAAASGVAWYFEGGGTQGLERLGIARPRSWAITLVMAVVTAFAGEVGVAAIAPLVIKLWGAPDFSALGSIRGNPLALLKWLLITWTTAAFAEEIVFRGFLISRIATGLGDTTVAKTIAVLAAATIFGLAHAYQGVSGTILAGIIGIVYGTSFLQSRGNLWRTILAHGLYDSTAFVMAYFSTFSHA